MKFYRLNQQIRAPLLRVIDQEGKQLGVLKRDEALAKAQAAEVDLVELAPNANPPVCKIVDYKKFVYLEGKKQRDARKKTRVGGTKELRLGPFMSENDLHVRIERGKEFLKQGYKLRLAVKFAGRQITHPEFGWQVLNKIIKALEDFGRVERAAKFEGKILATTLTPGKAPHQSGAGQAKNYEQTKNNQSGSETLQSNQNG
ncbi:translation initiation factor IF-3 [Candidatus Microgenomates bacterium]|nr:translation initiation factor IF-3 [Candidatus Microgenomates bacterium]